jgi:hypothetical protein
VKELKEITADTRLNVVQVGVDGGAGFIYTLFKKMVWLNFVFSWGMGWDHVSISKKINDTPTWEEMKYAKDLFFNEDETVVQFHPKKSEYVNVHPYTLHLWKKQGEEIELPPTWMV